jgi:hypothetical protein
MNTISEGSRDCWVCGGPVERTDRCWIDVEGRRYRLCDFHHAPFERGAAWVQHGEGHRPFFRFKEEIRVTRFPL